MAQTAPHVRICLLVALAATSCVANGSSAAPSKAPEPMSARPVTPWVQLALDPPITGFRSPVQVVHAGDGSKRLFVVEQFGLVRVVKDGKIEPAPFLDATKMLGASGGEQGLLGLVFHPKFKENGRLFFAYTDQEGDNAFAEVRVGADGKVDMKTLRGLFAVEDFASNHNGGMLTFGPDGKLWIGTGDGGGAGDPQRTSQSQTSFLGKMLTFDVDAKDAKPVVVYKGLRNPWRYSFDRQTGDLWIADVGQNAWEYVYLVEKARLHDKLDFGWSKTEGAHCFRPKSGCDATGVERVVFEYPHGEDGCSITGGSVYRGKAFPALVGSYVVGDYCTGRIWTIKGRTEAAKALDSHLLISSFGEDEDGELWLVDHGGSIRRVTAVGRR